MPDSLRDWHGRGKCQPFQNTENEDEPLLGLDFDNYEFESGQRIRKKRHCLVFSLLATVIIASVAVAGFVYVTSDSDTGGPNDITSSSATNHAGFKNAVVAADSTQCSEVGRDILKGGGNAVDAAISALLCSGLTDPQSAGIGGGFFMTIYNRTTGESTVIDSRETAPGAATPDMFEEDPSLSSSGPLSIAIPAEIKGYWYAHQQYGRLPWEDLFAPAVKMAEDGFPVPIGLHKAILSYETLLSTEPSFRSVFINPKTGELFREGEIMKRPQLAETLRVIGREGASAFFDGSLTDALMEDLKDIGSIITRDDLKNYKVLEKKPIQVSIGDDGMKVFSPPPPGSGPILSFILNILEGYKFKPSSIASDEARILTYHRTIEAFKFAYAKRTALGDEDFIDVEELVKNLTSADYAAEIRGLISDHHTYNYTYYGPTFASVSDKGTTHMSVLDQDGSAVSVTSTINAGFGCKFRGTRTGIIFNNEMDDFSTPNVTNEWGLAPSPANFIAPGKRPLSSMCPAVFVDKEGDVTAVLGAAGGSLITTTTAWVAEHILWLGQSIKEAIDGNRLHHQLLPPVVQYEEGFEKDILKGLEALGHKLKSSPKGRSVSQGIQVKEGVIYAESDPRKGGTPAGF